MTINEQLKKIRKEQKMTQKQVAEGLGCDYKSVLNFEKDYHAWKNEQVERYARLLGYRIETNKTLIKID